jgi:hypothetical protein
MDYHLLTGGARDWSWSRNAIRSRLVQAEPRVATILSFSMSGNLRRVPPRPDMRAEVIVFPRTNVRALRRLSDMGADMGSDYMGDDAPPCGEHAATTPDDHRPA